MNEWSNSYEWDTTFYAMYPPQQRFSMAPCEARDYYVYTTTSTNIIGNTFRFHLSLSSFPWILTKSSDHHPKRKPERDELDINLVKWHIYLLDKNWLWLFREMKKTWRNNKKLRVGFRVPPMIRITRRNFFFVLLVVYSIFVEFNVHHEMLQAWSLHHQTTLIAYYICMMTHMLHIIYF